MVLKKYRSIEKVTIRKNGQKTTHKTFSENTEKSEKNFMDLDYHDNTLQSSLKSFHTSFSIILRNSEIHKQTKKHII